MGMNSPAFGEHLGSVEQRVLQDAYSAIERAGGPDPANVMFMEQLLQEERMRERQVMMAEREALVSRLCLLFLSAWHAETFLLGFGVSHSGF
jgi:hypothetical protein